MIAKSLSTSRRYAALHDVAGRLGEFCQALYPLLVAHADDFGRLAGDAFTVKHLVLPASPRSIADVDQALMYLGQVCLVQRYDTDRGICLQILDFDAHQAGLHKRTASQFPEPPGISGNFREFPFEEKRTEEKRSTEAVENVEKPNVLLLLQLAHELRHQSFETIADLKEALKVRAAQRHIAYDAATIAQVLDLLHHSCWPLEK